jgi:hypothetical protein
MPEQVFEYEGCTVYVTSWDEGGAFFAEVGVGLQTEPSDDGLERRVVGRVGPFPARAEAVRAGYARGSRWFDEHPGFQ